MLSPDATLYGILRIRRRVFRDQRDGAFLIRHASHHTPLCAGALDPHLVKRSGDERCKHDSPWDDDARARYDDAHPRHNTDAHAGDAGNSGHAASDNRAGAGNNTDHYRWPRNAAAR